MDLDGVRPVLRRASAVAAAHGLEEAVVFAPAGVDPAEAGVALHCLGPGNDLVWHRGCERAKDDVGQSRVGLPAADDGRGGQAVHDRAERRLDPDEIVESLVDWHIRIDQAFQRVGAGGESLGEGRVNRRAPLRVGAGEVEGYASVVDSNRRLEADRPVGKAIVVDLTFSFERAAWEPAKLGPGARRGVFDERVDVGGDGRATKPREQLRKSALPGHVCRDLGAQVAGGFSLAPNLGEDEPKDVVDDRTVRDQADDWNDHALLEDLAKGADGGRRTTADVDVVGQVRDVAEKLAVVEHRRDHGDVVEVNPAAVGIVGNEHVAGLEAFRAVGPNRLRNDLDHRPEVDRLSEGLRGNLQSPIEERAGEVRPGLDVRRVGASPERQCHLLRRRGQRVARDLKGDRIEPGGVGHDGMLPLATFGNDGLLPAPFAGTIPGMGSGVNGGCDSLCARRLLRRSTQLRHQMNPGMPRPTGAQMRAQ